MQSSAKTVDGYIKEAPVERKYALTKLRDLCRKNLKGFEEKIAYGGPCYARDGVVELGFGSQKHFIGLYFMRLDVLNAYRDLVKKPGISIGKSVFRFSSPDKIDFALIEKILIAARESKGEIHKMTRG